MKTTVYHRQGLRLLDAINFSFVYILRPGMTCELAKCLGSSVLAGNLNLIGRFVTPRLTGRSFSIVFSYGKLRDSSLTYFPAFVVLYLKLVENIDQMHEGTFLLLVH